MRPGRCHLFPLDLESNATGLERLCKVMIDTIVTVARSAIGYPIGEFERDNLLRVDRALALFVGIA